MALATGQIDLKNINETINVVLSKDSVIFAGSNSTALAGATDIIVSAFIGKNSVPFTIGTIIGTPGGMNKTVTNVAGTNNQKVNIAVTTAMITPSGVVVIPVTVAGATVNKEVSFAIAFSGGNGQDGIDAKLISLTGSGQTFIKNTSGTVSPTTITITADVQNTSVTTWSYSVDGGTFSTTAPTGVSRTGSTVTVTGSTMTAKSIVVKASDGTYSDVYTVSKVEDGGNALSPVISNSSHTVPASSGGAVSSYSGSGTTIQVFEGATPLTFHTTIANGRFTIGTPTISPASKITVGAISGSGTSTATVAAHSAMDGTTDSVVITYPITAKRADGTQTTFSVTQTITKSKTGEKGDNGANGSNGADGYTVILTSESHTFAGSTTAALAGTATSNVIVYKGATQIASSITSITGLVTGLTAPITGNGTTSNYFTATATTALVARNGELTVNISADGKTFVKKFTFTVTRDGTNGNPGGPGSPGTPAKLVDIVPSALYFVTNTVGTDPSTYVYAPSSIALTPTFQSCTYSKWEYSVNGSTWTTITTQNGLSINSTSKVLTVSSSSTLFNSTQTFLIFKCSSTTGEADVVTLNRIFESGALAGRVSVAESNINQTAQDITLRVKKDEIISTINQTAESVTIDASKININGAVTFGSFDTSLQNNLNQRARTFTSTPVTPYSLGDIWKNGTTTWMCKVARASGAYVAADWEKVGDVTSANTSADTAKVNNVAASTISTGAAAGTAAKTRTDSWTYTGQTTIDGGKIQADTITATQIAANTITATQIAGDTITADKIAANTITVNELASNVGSSLDLSSNTAITARVTTTAMNTALSGKEDSVLKQTTAPAHLNGRLWLDTSVTPNVLKRSTGSAWVKVTPTTGAEIGLTDAAITQKVEANTTTLAKKSEVEQVDNAWQAAFYESVSGGENILEKTETMENWSVFSGATLNVSQGWVYMLANGTVPFAKTQTKIRTNEKYVFSVDLYSLNLNTSSAMAAHWRTVGASSWNRTIFPVSASTGVWVRVSMPIFVAGSGEVDIEISVDCYGATSGEIWYRRPQLEQGDLFSGWKPSSKELYSGITKINKDGINVSVSSSNVNTQIAYDGLTIKDGDSILASFGEVGSVVPFLSANHITSPSTVGIVYNQVITVGPGKQYSTINDALNGVFSSGFRYIRGEVLFNIYGDISEIVEINSLIGGKLTLQFFPGSKLYGRIFIRNCMSEINIVSYDSSSVANMGLVRPPSGAGIGIDIVNCTHVYIRGIILAGTNAYQGIKIQRGGVLFVRDCDFSGLTDTAVLAADGSLAMMTDNKGSNVGWAGWAYPGARVYATGMIPNATNGVGTDRGLTWLSGTTPTASSYNPPAVTAKTFTQYFTSATFDTLHHGTSNVSSYYGASAAQNRWDSSNGWTDGRIRFGAEIYNFFAGGSNIQVQMRLRRKNSSHGNSGAVMPAPYNHSASYPSGATRGGWTGWATVPSSLFTSGGATLTYYNGVQGINGYAIWDAVEVWVSVTKNV